MSLLSARLQFSSPLISLYRIIHILRFRILGAQRHFVRCSQLNWMYYQQRFCKYVRYFNLKKQKTFDFTLKKKNNSICCIKKLRNKKPKISTKSKIHFSFHQKNKYKKKISKKKSEFVQNQNYLFFNWFKLFSSLPDLKERRIITVIKTQLMLINVKSFFPSIFARFQCGSNFRAPIDSLINWIRVFWVLLQEKKGLWLNSEILYN